MKDTKQPAQSLMHQDVDTAMGTREWLFRSYIGTDDNHERIDTLLPGMKKK